MKAIIKNERVVPPLPPAYCYVFKGHAFNGCFGFFFWSGFRHRVNCHPRKICALSLRQSGSEETVVSWPADNGGGTDNERTGCCFRRTANRTGTILWFHTKSCQKEKEFEGDKTFAWTDGHGLNGGRKNNLFPPQVLLTVQVYSCLSLWLQHPPWHWSVKG